MWARAFSDMLRTSNLEFLPQRKGNDWASMSFSQIRGLLCFDSMTHRLMIKPFLASSIVSELRRYGQSSFLPYKHTKLRSTKATVTSMFYGSRAICTLLRFIISTAMDPLGFHPIKGIYGHCCRPTWESVKVKRGGLISTHLFLNRCKKLLQNRWGGGFLKYRKCRKGCELLFIKRRLFTEGLLFMERLPLIGKLGSCKTRQNHSSAWSYPSAWSHLTTWMGFLWALNWLHAIDYQPCENAGSFVLKQEMPAITAG